MQAGIFGVFILIFLVDLTTSRVGLTLPTILVPGVSVKIIGSITILNPSCTLLSSERVETDSVDAFHII